MVKTLFSLFLVFAFSGSLLAQQSSDELKKKQSDIQREIDELRQSLNDTKKNKKASLGQLSMITKKLRLREQAINNINEQIDVIQGSISKNRNEIDRKKRELDTLKAQYARSIVYAYKNRNSYDFLNFIFSASNFNDALRRIEYLKSYRDYREQQATSIKNAQQGLQQEISGLESSQKRKSETLKEQEKEKLVLVDERKEKDVVVQKLKADERKLNKELTDKQNADKKLRNGIMAAVRREADKARAEALRRDKEEAAERAAAAKKAAAEKAARDREATAAAKDKEPSTTTTTPAPAAVVKKEAPVAVKKEKSVFSSTPEGELLSDNFEKNRGKLPWPVEKGNIKIHFGPYRIIELKITGNNPGLTIETEEGGSVKAVFDGEVVSVFEVDGSSAVLIRHGKYFTTYSNLNGVSVSRGQQVKANQVLGKAASNSDGNGEIEFVLLQDTRNLDPEPWIRKR